MTIVLGCTHRLTTSINDAAVRPCTRTRKVLPESLSIPPKTYQPLAVLPTAEFTFIYFHRLTRLTESGMRLRRAPTWLLDRIGSSTRWSCDVDGTPGTSHMPLLCVSRRVRNITSNNTILLLQNKPCRMLLEYMQLVFSLFPTPPFVVAGSLFLPLSFHLTIAMRSRPMSFRNCRALSRYVNKYAKNTFVEIP
jgi:hypothetical protein